MTRKSCKSSVTTDMILCKIFSLLEGCWASPRQASQAKTVLGVLPGRVAPLANERSHGESRTHSTRDKSGTG